MTRLAVRGQYAASSAPHLSAHYHAYLASNVWRGRRYWAIEDAKGICELCEDDWASDVHHLTYARFGNETPRDLMALCRRCHTFADYIRRSTSSDDRTSLRAYYKLFSEDPFLWG